MATDKINESLSNSRKPNSLLKQFATDLLICAIIVTALLMIIRPTIVNQTSMLPNCKPGDYIILNKVVYTFNEPERGDIIVFRSKLPNVNDRGSKLLIKRVIGLPGEHIEIKSGCVYIDGEYLNENDYLNDNIVTEGDVNFTLPEDEYFCMGDNRSSSLDSRSDEVGNVKKSDIYGKATIRLFPVNRFGSVYKEK